MLVNDQLNCNEDHQSVNTLDCEDSDTESVPSTSHSPKRHLITNADYKDIVRDLNFLEDKAKVLLHD